MYLAISLNLVFLGRAEEIRQYYILIGIGVNTGICIYNQCPCKHEVEIGLQLTT
jgi:hypothetical protein